MNGQPTPWDATLDELQAAVERIEDALDAGRVPTVVPWSPPAGLAPLPAELWQRATSLSWRLAAVEQRTRDRRDALQGELDDLARRRGAGAAYAAAGSTTNDPRETG